MASTIQRPPPDGWSFTIEILKLAWRKWKAFAHILGNFQARVLLTVFYLLIAGPTGLFLRLRQDPLGLRHPSGSSYWLERKTRDLALDDARRQY